MVSAVASASNGEDQSVIRFRRGLDARSIPAIKFRIPDLMQVASRVMEQVNAHEPEAVFVDATGIGWGGLGRLKQVGRSRAGRSGFGGRGGRADGGGRAAEKADKRPAEGGRREEGVRV